MTPAELLALADRLLYGCRDPVTGERLYAGLPAEAIVEDVEAAARYLRACAEAEPAAWMESPHGVIRANPLYRWTAPQSLAWTIPLYTHPQPPSDQDDAVEALHGVASEHDIGYAAGWRSCADEATRIVTSHIDRLEPGKQLRTRDALLDLLASMRSILVSQRAAKETTR